MEVGNYGRGVGELTVILLALVLVDCSDDLGEAKDGVLSAAVGEYVLDQGALAGVGS